MRLFDRLEEYSGQDYYGFHMPGHKRNVAFMGIGLPYGIDITEIDGFDDLHHADGILKEAQEKAAAVFDADETHFLINGSTAGILSGILGCTKKGDKVLLARHCHKSVYHAIYMNELTARYLYPEFDGTQQMNGEILAEDVRRRLNEEPDIRAVIIVSPNYDGVVSDVKQIAEVVHEYGIPLIVDEAHGAHFGFHPYFPERANRLGADVVINSLHKTLPSLTQTALLHLNGTIVDKTRVRKYLDMLQSSSPSYVLMASIDACVDMLKEKSKKAFDSYAKRLKESRKSLAGLRCLELLKSDNYDSSKIVISTAGTDISSNELHEKLLNDYHLQMEMTAPTYILAMTSIADTEAGFDRLEKALFEIDDALAARISIEEPNTLGKQDKTYAGMPHLEQVLTPYEASAKQDSGESEAVLWEDSAGRVSMEYAYLYPPGSPVIVPGERISQEAVMLLEDYRKKGFQVEGMQKEGSIEVWSNE